MVSCLHVLQKVSLLSVILAPQSEGGELVLLLCWSHIPSISIQTPDGVVFWVDMYKGFGSWQCKWCFIKLQFTSGKLLWIDAELIKQDKIIFSLLDYFIPHERKGVYQLLLTK